MKNFYIKDHLGSTRAVVNDQGTVVEAYDYYPFGLLMPGRSYATGEETKEKFTGKERDSETGLDYFGARYYSSALGKWFSVDPLATSRISLSPYHYTKNNPINRIDPDGKRDYLAAFYASLRSVRGGLAIASGHALIISGAASTFATSGLAAPIGYLKVSAGIGLNVWGGFEIGASVADFTLAMKVPDGVDAEALGNLALEIAEGLGVDATDAAIIGLIADLVATGPDALKSLKELLGGKSLKFLESLINADGYAWDIETIMKAYLELQSHENEINEDGSDDKDDEDTDSPEVPGWNRYDPRNQ